MQVTTFSLAKKIRPCYVTKSGLKLLEDYLLKTVPEIIAKDNPQPKTSYSMSISDDLGAEVIRSISDFSFPKFSDSTSEIVLDFSVDNPNPLQLSVRLADEDNSRISLKHSSNNPRETVSAILDGIKRILESDKIGNGIFYLSNNVKAMLAIAGILLFVLGAELLTTPWRQIGIVCLAAVGGLILFFSVGRKLNRYIEFESNSYQTRKAWNNWFKLGLVGFLIFSIALPKIIKLLFE